MPYTVPEFTAISTCYKPPSVNPPLAYDNSPPCSEWLIWVDSIGRGMKYNNGPGMLKVCSYSRVLSRPNPDMFGTDSKASQSCTQKLEKIQNKKQTHIFCHEYADPATVPDFVLRAYILQIIRILTHMQTVSENQGGVGTSTLCQSNFMIQSSS
jgi:hypothetical protein